MRDRWTRAMLFHPHVHMLVTAGGLSFDGAGFIPNIRAFWSLFKLSR